MVVTKAGVAVCLTLLASACSGSSGDGDELVYTRADLARFVAIPPTATGWDWPERSEPPQKPYTRADLIAYRAPDQSLAMLQAAKLDAGYVEGRTRTWRSSSLKGSSGADLYETPDGAQDGLEADEAFAEETFPAASESARPSGLGGGAWGVRGTGSGRFVVYGWRRGNVTLGVAVECRLQCPSGVGDAALAWARAIDQAATD